MVSNWIFLSLIVFAVASGQSNEFWDDDYKDLETWWSQEAADDVLGLAEPREEKKESEHNLDDYVLEPEASLNTDNIDAELADPKQTSIETDDDKFDDEVDSKAVEDAHEAPEKTNTVDENEDSDRAVNEDILQFLAELDNSDDVFDGEKTEDENKEGTSDEDLRDEPVMETTLDNVPDDKTVLKENDEEEKEEDNTEIENDEVVESKLETSEERNSDNEESKMFDEVIEDQQDHEVNSFEDSASDETEDEQPLETSDNDAIEKNDEENKKELSAVENELESDDDDDDDDDNISLAIDNEETDSNEDTVDKVYKDLHEDLEKLFQTWDKLNDDSDDDNVQEYEEKYGRPFREDNVLSQREDIEAYDEDVDLNIDSNLKDIFNANEDETDALNPIKAILDPEQEKAKLARIYDEGGIVPYEDAEETLPESNKIETTTTEETVLFEESSTLKHISVDELNTDQYNDLIRQFKASHAEELDTHREDFGRSILPIHLTMTDEEITEVTSPNYPSAYPNNNVVDWILQGNGMGVELNVSDLHVRGVQGDYLLIKPGGADESGHDGLVFTFHLNAPRKYRFTDVDRVFVRFVSGPGLVGFMRGFKLTAKMIWPLGSRGDESIPTPEPLSPSPPGFHTVHLGGLSLQQFMVVEDRVRRLLANMATMYINANGIEEGLNSTLDTTTLTSSHCNRNWPEFETCVQVTFGIPLVYEDEAPTRLDEDDLRTMWDEYSGQDPFAATLSSMGLALYAVPDDGRVLTMWLVLATGVLVCAVLLGLALWRFSCLEDYTRMKTYSDTDSMRDDKRNLDLYPTPHQHLPPLYSDDFKWADTKYDDTTRVELGGITNTSYVRDELLDLDSDEDVITTRDGFSFGARNVYQV